MERTLSNIFHSPTGPSDGEQYFLVAVQCTAFFSNSSADEAILIAKCHHTSSERIRSLKKSKLTFSQHI
jgi:hypothetical protein